MSQQPGNLNGLEIYVHTSSTVTVRVEIFEIQPAEIDVVMLRLRHQYSGQSRANGSLSRLRPCLKLEAAHGSSGAVHSTTGICSFFMLETLKFH